MDPHRSRPGRSGNPQLVSIERPAREFDPLAFLEFLKKSGCSTWSGSRCAGRDAPGTSWNTDCSAFLRHVVHEPGVTSSEAWQILEDINNQQLGYEFGPEAAGSSSAEVEQVARLTVRFCYALRDANRLSWFASEVREQIDALHADLTRILEEGPVRIHFENEAIRIGDARLGDPPKAARQLIGMVHRKGLRAIEFVDGLRPLDVVVLLQLIQSKSKSISGEDRAQLRFVNLIETDEPDRIRIPEILEPSRLGSTLREDADGDTEVRSLVCDITRAIDNISSDGESDAAPSMPKPSDDDPSSLLELVDQLGHNAEIALILSSLRRHDSYTYDHSINVGLLSICLARHVGWRGRDLHEFGVAALIHDVGKLYTPLEVLNKPGRLTPQEWIVMKRHPRDGFDILKEGGVGSDIAPYIAIEHHTQPDGVGYPPLPYGVERMHPGSKMVKIADAYDAFTTIRPYRSQTRPKEVLKMLRSQADKQFDGELVEAFIEMMGDYPIGSTLKLTSGRIGLVVDVHQEAPDRPLVRILQKADGRKARNLELIDLRTRDDASGGFVDSVEEAIDPVIRNIPIGRYI